MGMQSGLNRNGPSYAIGFKCTICLSPVGPESELVKVLDRLSVTNQVPGVWGQFLQRLFGFLDWLKQIIGWLPDC